MTSQNRSFLKYCALFTMATVFLRAYDIWTRNLIGEEPTGLTWELIGVFASIIIAVSFILAYILKKENI